MNKGKLITYAVIAAGSQFIGEPFFQSLPDWQQALIRALVVGVIAAKAYTSNPSGNGNGKAPTVTPSTEPPKPEPQKTP
jgi:hypothetical protein